MGWKAILELPSFCESETFGSTKAQVSLEEAIRRDFGQESIARFNEYNIEVDAPINNPEFKLGYAYYGSLRKKMGDDGIIGNIYQVNMHHIQGINADRVPTRLIREGDGTTTFSLTLDLNPDQETKRYLKMLFAYK